ncbi:MAG TPA: hypothetical protein VLI04_22555 [Nocardioidaceae bacterium]|nr:hypothetical protein [Nocardioidaceae bacterium]
MFTMLMVLGVLSGWVAVAVAVGLTVARSIAVSHRGPKPLVPAHRADSRHALAA